MGLTNATRIPVATYRFQLRREFPFGTVRDLLPYLATLGISDLYCSPIFLSTPGSTHGYDVNDYRRIDPELGGREALGELHEQLRGRDMGLLLDFVPNHMGINGPGLFNEWWREVLENGYHSPYARFFDIDWRGIGSSDTPRVLVPTLEDHYGRVVSAGKLSLVYQDEHFQAAYYDMRFPLRPRSYAALLGKLEVRGETADRLADILRALEQLPRPDALEDAATARSRTARLRDIRRRIAALLESRPDLRAQLDALLDDINGTGRRNPSYDALNDILEDQHYRLAFWKAGVHETNYRRFFAIDTLIGLRMELPEVFEETHALLRRLIREGAVTGLRIDHVDGLRLPKEYLDRLQRLAADELKRAEPFFVVVEKILGSGEPLPTEWACHGTTGYEFVEHLAGLFVDSRSERWFDQLYRDFCDERASFDELVFEQKKIILDEMFANAVLRLGGLLADVLQGDPNWRDLTRNEVTVAVREMMAAHSVYRTYRRELPGMNDRDRGVVERAAALAISRHHRLGAEPFELVRDVITGVYPPAKAPAEVRETLANWVLEFQQYTGAIMAKSVEDTAFYAHSRFIALNEVGGNPMRFGASVAQFHESNIERLRVTPHGLIATSTHDTKLGEDVRARLYALSEIPHEWEDWVREWRELNRRHKTTVDGREAPDANEEYRLYQVLIGAWPADDSDPNDAFKKRIREHLRKAVNEAKRNTTWTEPNEAWLAAGDHFIDGLLGAESGREFLASFRVQAQRVAQLGMVNSLSQVVLKTMSPGVPDFYQGSELWDLSLVDPDNRREVNYTKRQKLVARTRVDWTELLRTWRNGAIKLHLTRALLQYRRANAELFQNGNYLPLEVRGRFGDQIAAFARAWASKVVVVVVPRLSSRLGSPPLGLVWDDTRIVLPPNIPGPWKNIFAQREVPPADEWLVAELFRVVPFAVVATESFRTE